MARIPVVQEPSIRPEGLPTPYARPFATPQGEGAGFGHLLDQGAQVATGYAIDARNRANIAAVSGAAGDGKTVVNLKVRDVDPNGVGYARLQGKDAMDARDKTLETVNKSLDEVNAKLTPVQQEMFAPHLQSLKDEAFSHIVSHESAQQNRYMDGLFQGNANATMQEMQMPDVLTDPAKLQQKRRDLLQNGINRAKELYGKTASREVIQAVVVPEMQKAAYGAMQTAVAIAEQADNPKIASDALSALGPDLVTAHQEHFAMVTKALEAKKAIKDAATAAVNPAATSVPVPGGAPVVRYDPNKVNANLAALPQDSQFLPEVQKAVKARQDVGDAQWKDTTAQVFSDALGEGQDVATGDFDIDKVSMQRKVWLNKYDPAGLERLRMLSDKGDKAARTAMSHDAYSELMLDMDANKETYKDMSVPQFRKVALDRGVSGLDLDKARRHFADVQKGGLSETINKTVAESLMSAFRDDPETRAHLQGDLLDATKEFVENWQKATQGQTPKTKDIRQFVEAELVSGKVKDVHWYYDPRVTRLEYQRTTAYRGKSFEPLDVTAKTIPEPAKGPPEVQAATPVETPTPRVPQMSDQDAAAIEWLGKNPKDPGAEKVRAKLRAKGIIGG